MVLILGKFVNSLLFENITTLDLPSFNKHQKFEGLYDSRSHISIKENATFFTNVSCIEKERSGANIEPSGTSLDTGRKEEENAVKGPYYVLADK